MVRSHAGEPNLLIMIDKKIILEALDKHWNIKPAAKELGIGYSTLRKYMKEYNIVHNSRANRDGPTFDRNAYSSKRVTKTRRIRKIESLEYKGGMKCMRCGFNEPIPDCYAFHHRNPAEKSPDWYKMKTHNHPMETIIAELDKCDVLCHNCHSIVHYYERQKINQKESNYDIYKT